jgi:nifR3 family TIM-barrel protein
MSLYHSIKIGTLSLPGTLFLAPVAGYTDRAFRSICVDHGADFTYTELASSEALVRGGVKTFRILERAHNEKHYAVQLFGSDPDVMYRAALLLAPLGPDVVDINAGCPVLKVVKNGAGSALMKNPVMLGRITASVVKAAKEALGSVPVTVKLRSGWDNLSCNYYECARAAVDSGAALVCLHPRTRGQGYSGASNWSHIADLVSRVAVPVAGSGDLFSAEDAKRMLEETRCAAVMFARGAQGNPFIFAATRDLILEGKWEAPAFPKRIAAAFRQLELLAEDVGERTACREMRKTFAAYTKGIAGAPGIAGGARLRDRLVHAETFADYRYIIEETISNQ